MNIFAVGVTVLLDQATKFWAKRNLSFNELKAVVPNKLYFIKTKNYGFSNNIMSHNPGFVKQLSLVVICVSLAYGAVALKKTGGLLKVCFGLMLGGGVSNLLDRYVDGYVTDFICLGKPNGKQRLIYNIADFFIFIGGFLYFGTQALQEVLSLLKRR